MSYDLKITVYNNRDYEQGFTLLDADSEPLDLTGCSLVFGIGDTSKTLKTHSTGTPATNKCIYITNALTGAIKLALPFTELKALPPATYVHDLILIDAAGKRSGIWKGQLIIKKGIA